MLRTRKPRVHSSALENATYKTRARRRATDVSQDCLYYLHAEAQKTSEAFTAEAVVRADRTRTLQQLAALVGTRLTRTTRTGADIHLNVSERHLICLRACVDGLYGLARKLARVEARVEPIVPTTRALGCSWASRYAKTAKRTWTKWLPWLHVAGVVVYQPGTHSNPTLVAFPTLYRSNVIKARAVVVERHARGFGVGEATEKELARRGRWWQPICATLLDNVSDASARADAAAAHVATWTEKVATAAAAKKTAILERIADAIDGDVVEAAANRVVEAHGRVRWVREQMDACDDDDQRLAWRRWASDADRRLLFAQDALQAAKNEKDTAAHPVRALVKLGRAALRRAVAGVGGGTASHRNVGSSSFRRVPVSAAQRTVPAARAVEPSPALQPAPTALAPPIDQASQQPGTAGQGGVSRDWSDKVYTIPSVIPASFAAFSRRHGD